MPAIRKKIAVNSDAAVTGRLKRTIKMTGLSNTEFCRATGIKYSTLSNWLYMHGTSFTINIARQFAELASKCGVHITTTWLLYGTGTLPRVENVSYTEKLQQAAIHQEQTCQQEIEQFSHAQVNRIVLLIADDGMEPCFSKGDYVGGELFQGDNIKLIINRNCIVKTVNHGILCRRLMLNKEQGYDLRMVNLFSEADKSILTKVAIEYAAPVTRVWRELDVYPA